MERAEKIGLGVASAAHVLLFAALSTSWISPNPLKLRNEPIEVSIADAVALRSAARRIAESAPPPPPGDVEGPPEQAAPAEDAAEPRPAPAPPEPIPAPSPDRRAVSRPRDEPRPSTPRPEAAKPKATDSGKQQQSRGSGLRLDTSDWVKSASRADTSAKASDGAPAAAIGPAQQSALAAEIRRLIKPFWKAPTGADADLLRTTLSVRLARDGSLIGDPDVVETTGITASNRAQVRLHQEQAIKAVRLAAPFRLPPDLYDGWKSFTVNVDRKLSQ